MSRRPEHISARKAIPRQVVREVMARSEGRCEALGCSLIGADLDHTIPVALGGKNEASNIKLLCRDHHDAKTKLDVKMIAKADRQGIRSGQQKRRKEKTVTRSPKIQSPGFNKKYRKKMNGEVVPR
jgi:5-methylcytosine-specific restriction endonuclease McrA